MGKVSLTGVSGRISFETGDPDKIVKLDRVQGKKMDTFACVVVVCSPIQCDNKDHA